MTQINRPRPPQPRPQVRHPAPQTQTASTSASQGIGEKARDFLRRLPKEAGILLILGTAVIIGSVFLQNAWTGLRTDRKAGAEEVTQVYAAGAIRMSEIMSSNATTRILSGNASPDWVEIGNFGTKPVNLKGYSLAKHAKGVSFTFPDHTLEAGECALVYCDGTLRTEGEYHAPFRISSEGDTVMLFNAVGTAIDTVNLPALGRDQSYVRLSSDTWRITNEATPSLANTQESYRALHAPTANDPLEISEIVASNKHYAPDTNGMYWDYIELHNTSANAVNLKGYYLSDNSEKNMKWLCSADAFIPAGEYILVYASGLDKIENGEIHANFKLSTEGEQVTLTNPKGQIVEKAEYGLMKADQAYTKQSDGSWRISTPTPAQ